MSHTNNVVGSCAYCGASVLNPTIHYYYCPLHKPKIPEAILTEAQQRQVEKMTEGMNVPEGKMGLWSVTAKIRAVFALKDGVLNRESVGDIIHTIRENMDDMDIEVSLHESNQINNETQLKQVNGWNKDSVPYKLDSKENSTCTKTCGEYLGLDKRYMVAIKEKVKGWTVYLMDDAMINELVAEKIEYKILEEIK